VQARFCFSFSSLYFISLLCSFSLMSWKLTLGVESLPGRSGGPNDRSQTHLHGNESHPVIDIWIKKQIDIRYPAQRKPDMRGRLLTTVWRTHGIRGHAQDIFNHFLRPAKLCNYFCVGKSRQVRMGPSMNTEKSKKT
jgi:hypothetical protein